MDDPDRDDSELGGPRADLGSRGIELSLRTLTGRARRASKRTASGRHLLAGNGLAGGAHRAAPGAGRRCRRSCAGHRFRPAKIRGQRVCAGARQGRRAPRSARPKPADGGSIAPGLRAILERCLDPDPGRRYRRGLELAEDLDRWRTDRPLVCTSEPFWGQTVPRLLRRQRRAILAAALSLVIILATTAVALVKSHQTLRALGLHKIGRLWDDPEARAYRFQRTNAPRLLQPDDSRVETAARALKEYDVLGPDDWRRRDDVRALPEAEREDLEVWLMEQVYLYCRALADRPDSPKDWSRAVKILDHVGEPGPIPAFAALRHRLSANLGPKDRFARRFGRSIRSTGAFLGQRIPARRGGRVRARIRRPGPSRDGRCTRRHRNRISEGLGPQSQGPHPACRRASA